MHEIGKHDVIRLQMQPARMCEKTDDRLLAKDEETIKLFSASTAQKMCRICWFGLQAIL